MKNESSENYLDQLLSALNDGDSSFDSDMSDALESVPMDDFEKDLFGGAGAAQKEGAKKEEDFLREFETELLKEDIPDFSEESFVADDLQPAAEPDETDASIADMLSYMNGLDQPETVPEPVSEKDLPALDDPVDIPEDLPALDDPMDIPEVPEPVLGIPDELPLDLPAADELAGLPLDIPAADDGEVDLSGMGSDDLLDILAGEGDLSDLGDLLSADESGTEVGDTAEFDNFAEAQMQAGQEGTAEPAEEEDGKKKKKRRKKEKKEKKDGESGGFFQKLGKVFFGEDEPESEVVAVSAVDTVDVAQLSAENQQILKEMDGEDEGKGKKGKKKKDKKEKKEKKEKPPKEPKPKKEKPKKEKKPKPPKEKDNTPPLPKGPVIAILIMVGSLMGLVLLGTKLTSYQTQVDQAKEYYGQGAYADAYSQLSGLDVKERDERLYMQLLTLGPVSSEYNTYLVFSDAGRQDMAVDALICAYGRYDENRESAREYECLGELEDLGAKIGKSLLEDYNITGEEALSLYNLRTRREYTQELRKLLRELGLEQG